MNHRGLKVSDVDATALVQHVTRRLSFKPSVQVVSETGSTNADLMASADACHQQVLIAKQQTSGVGRRGSQWVSPEGGNLYLSAGWQFEVPLERLVQLPLMVAARVADELELILSLDVQLKWPNDLFSDDKKLGGILVESTRLQGDITTAVIGIGINVNVVPEDIQVERPVTSLSEQLAQAVSLQSVAEAVSVGVFSACRDVVSPSGYDWQQAWSQRDLLLGREIVVNGPGLSVGVARGLSEDGGLLVEHHNTMDTLYAGEVSLGALET